MLGGAVGGRIGDPLPAPATRLDDVPMLAVGGQRQAADLPIVEGIALGRDDWSIVWGTRLAPPIVNGMTSAIAADSYSVVDRAGTTCVLAVFQTADELSGTALLAGLTQWAAGSPPAAQATAIPLGPTRMQLEACDPGPSVAVAPNVGSVDALIQRQIDRLATSG
jgi:hypothetical protein